MLFIYKKYVFIVIIWRLNLTWKIANFQHFLFFFWWQRRKNQSEVLTYVTQSLLGLAVCKECQMNVSMGSKSKTTKTYLQSVYPPKDTSLNYLWRGKEKKMLESKIHQATFKLLFLWCLTSRQSGRKKLDRVITEMIATDNWPFNFVANKGFQRLMATAEPRYTLKQGSPTFLWVRAPWRNKMVSRDTCPNK